MSDPAPNITFNNEQSGANSKNVQGMKIVEGDEVTGDKIGNQVQGDNLGSMEQTNVSGGDYNAKCKEAVGKLLSEMADAESSTYVPPVEIADRAHEGDPAYETATYHPLGLMSTINELADRDAPPSASEEQSLKERLTTMLGRVGTAGKKVLVNLGPIAVAGMRATAQITPPWNIVCPIVEAAVNQFGKSNSPEPFDEPPGSGW